MKSLERLEHIKNAPEFMGGDERYKNSINSPIKYIEDIMAIKQDLEVLEIIKKKHVDIPLISLLRRDAYSRYDYENKANEYILEKYNERLYLIPMCLTLEELMKIRKWLEDTK